MNNCNNIDQMLNLQKTPLTSRAMGCLLWISLRKLTVLWQWRDNDLDGVSNHQPHDCLLNCLFRIRSKKTSKLRITGLCVRNSPVTHSVCIWDLSSHGNHLISIILTHWGWDKITAIFQATFSHVFPWMKMYKFRLRFHWSLFPRVQLMGLMQQATHLMWDYVRGRLRKQAAFTHSIENSVILDGSRHVVQI